MKGPSRLKKPPYAGVLVVEASELLSFGEKALWRRVYSLDQSERGAYASAVTLGEDLGVSARTIERLREGLAAKGLLTSDKRPGRGGAAWFVWLPPAAWPKKDRITRAERQALVEGLDGWIRITLQDAASPTGLTDFPAPLTLERTPTHLSDFPAPEIPTTLTLNPDTSVGLSEEIPTDLSPEVIDTPNISPSGEIYKPLTSGEVRVASRDTETAGAGDARRALSQFA